MFRRSIFLVLLLLLVLPLSVDAKAKPKTTIQLTSPKAGKVIPLGTPIVETWKYSGAPDNTQVFIELKLIKRESSLGNLSGGTWQSPELQKKKGRGTNKAQTGKSGSGYLDTPGTYSLTASIRDCHPAGCHLNPTFPEQEVAIKTHATSTPIIFTVSSKASNESSKKQNTNPIVILRTNKGSVFIELFMDKTPITAGNFLKLAKEKFYDGTKFHRVIDDFMIQGGDPNTKGDDTTLYGKGGPGYAIKDEFVAGLSNIRGTISMANSGPNTGGSQFFINTVDNYGLDFDIAPSTSNFVVFGKVVKGMAVIDKISSVSTGQNDVPTKPVVISSVKVVKSQ